MITLKTLPNATRQEVFDQVSSHLLKQMKHSKKKNGICAYRAGRGLKCAAGCLIADDEYDKEFDNAANGVCWSMLIRRRHVPNVHEDLIMGLQHIHDNFEPERWPWRLRNLAEKEGLEFKEPTN